MKYQSTRGEYRGLSFEEALFSGFLPDGGILLPESIPNLDEDTLRKWSHLTFPQLVVQIMSLFIDEAEIPHDDLKSLIDKAFLRFKIPEVVQVVNLEDGLKIAELFHGPTFAFKDIALSCVGQFIEYFLEKRKKHVTIVVGTSGDTGSAAIESVRGLNWVDIIVLLPRGRCTQIQELQMTTVLEPNVHVFRVDGTSDDMDVSIKACFLDEEFAKKHNLCSINSINWVRILSQIAHYFYSYFQVCPGLTEEVEVIVPTGACGNVTAGIISQRMGLRIKLLCAVNSNDIVARTLNDADFSVGGDVTQTLASAMDIQVPYNMERILHLFSNGDCSLVRGIMSEMESKGSATIPPELHQKIQSVMFGASVSDEQIKETMRQCWHDNHYLLCPHTAVAAHIFYKREKRTLPSLCVCIATASPGKFEEAVLSAGITPPTMTKELLDLLDKPVRYEEMERNDDWTMMLRLKIEVIEKRIKSS